MRVAHDCHGLFVAVVVERFPLLSPSRSPRIALDQVIRATFRSLTALVAVIRATFCCVTKSIC